MTANGGHGPVRTPARTTGTHPLGVSVDGGFVVDGCVLVCPPTTQVPACPAAARSCARCAMQVWVSRTMVGGVDAGELAPCCFRCAATELPFDELERATERHPRQRASMSAHRYREVAGSVLGQLRQIRRGGGER